MIISPLKTAVIADGATTSAVADLGQEYEKIVVYVPTLTGATVTVQVSFDNSTFGTLYIVDPAAGTTAAVTLAETRMTVVAIGGMRYVKFVANSAQSGSAATVYVRGVKN